ncbi:MAG: cytochrome c [Acidobacteria bacterium]|nr:cytochrome c [Acidobacteriota bacterium]
MGRVGAQRTPRRAGSGASPARRAGSRRRRRLSASALPLLAALAAGALPAGATSAAAQTGGGSAERQASSGETEAQAERFGFGRPATPEEIAAWDLDVRPDGTGLPEGEGTAASGAPIYAVQCAVCHGPNGEGGIADRLVGYDPASTPPFGPRYEAWRGDGADVRFSVGNYWPYATTLYDYILRAMPSASPGSLAPDEVYGLVAWILAENGIIARDAVMNASTLPAVEMPARDIFVPQER